MEIRLPGTFTMANILYALQQALISVSTQTERWKWVEVCLATVKRSHGSFSTVAVQAWLMNHRKKFPFPWKRWVKSSVKLDVAAMNAEYAYYSHINVIIENPDARYNKFDKIWKSFADTLNQLPR